jgi:hypothetical protein
MCFAKMYYVVQIVLPLSACFLIVRATGGEKTKYDGMFGNQKQVLCTHMYMCVNKTKSIKGEVTVYSVSFRLRGPVMLDVRR